MIPLGPSRDALGGPGVPSRAKGEVNLALATQLGWDEVEHGAANLAFLRINYTISLYIVPAPILQKNKIVVIVEITKYNC